MFHERILRLLLITVIRVFLVDLLITILVYQLYYESTKVYSAADLTLLGRLRMRAVMSWM